MAFYRSEKHGEPLTMIYQPKALLLHKANRSIAALRGAEESPGNTGHPAS
jgi:hypothetical protein